MTQVTLSHNTIESDVHVAVYRILDPSGKTAGTAFLVAPKLVVTCAHVIVGAKSERGQHVRLMAYVDGFAYDGIVQESGWSDDKHEDIAFIKLIEWPSKAAPLTLGASTNRNTGRYFAFGFASRQHYLARPVSDEISGIMPVDDRRPLLQLKGDLIDAGMSGAPVMDNNSGRVIGMVNEYDDFGRGRLAAATTAETIAALWPDLRIWPDAYGPREVNTYLDDLVERTSTLMLTGGTIVRLERIYISLRVDAMNQAEREAKRDWLLADLAKILPAVPAEPEARYARHTAIRRTIMRLSRKSMQDASNYEQLFGKRKISNSSVAQVIQSHAHVVLLGDPGSGKTTLTKWLALAFAKALLRGDSRAEVLANQVSASGDDNVLVDLGECALPILIRIGEYARARWKRGHDDGGLSIDDFLGSNTQFPNTELPAASVRALMRDALASGKAIVFLDGLDEVANPDQRIAVAHEMRRFIAVNQRCRTILTSRIVGYDLAPLVEIPHYIIDDMDDLAIRAFCRAWVNRSVPVDDIAAENLANAVLVDSHPGVRELAGNPLLLTILALVQERNVGRRLPARRVELFADALHALYCQRESYWDACNVSEQTLAHGLAAVAYHLQTEESLGFSDAGTVRACLRGALGRDDWIEAILTVANEGSGFLVARGEGIFCFVHRALQEYFVARYFTEGLAATPSQLVAHVFDPAWREPIVLALGIVSAPDYVGGRSELELTLRAILDYPDPIGDVVPRRELLCGVALSECERTQQDIAHEIGKRLLSSFATTTNERIKEQIEALFQRLQTAPAFVGLNQILASGIAADKLVHRRAAMCIVIDRKWYSAETVRAMLRTYSAPSSPRLALLVGLHEARSLHPELFEQIGESELAFRRTMIEQPELWNRWLADLHGRAILQMLYFRAGETVFEPQSINRDSWLTETLLHALRAGVPLVASLRSIWSRLDGSSTVGDRGLQLIDVALGLAGCGDRRWMTAMFEREATLGNIFYGSAIYVIARHLGRAITRAVARTVAVGLALDLDLGLELPRLLVCAVARDRELELAPDRNLELGLGRALARDPDLAQALALNLALDRQRSVFHVVHRGHGTDHDLAFLRARLFAVARVIEHKLGRDLARNRALDRALESELDRDLALVIDARPSAFLTEVRSALTWVMSDRTLQDSFREEIETSLNVLGTVYQGGEVFYSTRVLSDYLKRRSDLLSLDPSSVRVTVPYVPTSPVISLERLPLELGSEDDTVREEALEKAKHIRYATTLGESRMVAVALAAAQNSVRPLIGAPLTEAVAQIVHDSPVLLETLMASANRAQHSLERAAILFLLGHVRYLWKDAILTLARTLPTADKEVNVALLSSIRWVFAFSSEEGAARPARTTSAWSSPMEVLVTPVGQLITTLWNWLMRENDFEIRKMILRALGAVPAALGSTVSERLLSTASAFNSNGDAPAEWLRALSALAVREPTHRTQVEQELKKRLPSPEAIAGCFRLAIARYSPRVVTLDHLQQDGLLTPTQVLRGLLGAGNRDDTWDESLGALTRLTHELVRLHADLILPQLASEFRSSMRALNEADSEGSWPRTRIALSVVTACTEDMPAALQRAFGDPSELQALLVTAATNARSVDMRRFAISAMGNLRVLTTVMAPVLFLGFLDVEAVAQAALHAAKQFSLMESDLLPELLSLLARKSPKTVIGVARLMGSLAANDASGRLRSRIIEALGEATRHPAWQGSDNDGKPVSVMQELFEAILHASGFGG